jgi:hypothetical protein
MSREDVHFPCAFSMYYPYSRDWQKRRHIAQRPPVSSLEVRALIPSLSRADIPSSCAKGVTHLHNQIAQPSLPTHVCQASLCHSITSAPQPPCTARSFPPSRPTSSSAKSAYKPQQSLARILADIWRFPWRNQTLRCSPHTRQQVSSAKERPRRRRLPDESQLRDVEQFVLIARGVEQRVQRPVAQVQVVQYGPGQV